MSAWIKHGCSRFSRLCIGDGWTVKDPKAASGEPVHTAGFSPALVSGVHANCWKWYNGIKTCLLEKFWRSKLI